MTTRMKCLKCSYSFDSRTLFIGDERVPQNQECPKCSGQAVEVLPDRPPVKSWNYPLEMVNGHMIVDADGEKCLLDTGSLDCITEGNEPAIEFAGRTWHATQKFLGVMLRDIAKQVGIELDAMIGSSVLTSLSWMPRMDEGIVSFYHSPPPEWMDNMAWKESRQSLAPLITVGQYSRSYNAVIDTGAKVCYAKRHIWDSVTGNIVNTTDFFPTPKGIEEFDVPMKVTTISMGGAVRKQRNGDGELTGMLENFQLPEVVLPLGVLPERLESLLDGFGADFILGPELLQAIPMAFGLERGRVFVDRGEH
jgi:hypothetical protein